MTAGIISRHHKNFLCVIINYFSTSVDVLSILAKTKCYSRPNTEGNLYDMEYLEEDIKFLTQRPCQSPSCSTSFRAMPLNGKLPGEQIANHMSPLRVCLVECQ
jgi:hypothetical protein